MRRARTSWQIAGGQRAEHRDSIAINEHGRHVDGDIGERREEPPPAGDDVVAASDFAERGAFGNRVLGVTVAHLREIAAARGREQPPDQGQCVFAGHGR